MNKPWETENCDEMFGYSSIYKVHVAAALWCGIPHNLINQYLDESEVIAKGIYRHPKIKCLEVKCIAMHNAIDSGTLPVSRENGKVITDHIAPDRRHVSRQHLKDWISKEFPANKPEFLFDDIERKTHASINTDSFHALQADRDATHAENEKLRALTKKLTEERDASRGENESLKAMVHKQSIPDSRSETTFLNIIGCLLKLRSVKSKL